MLTLGGALFGDAKGLKLTWHHVGEQEIDPMEIKLVEERLYYRLNPFGGEKNLRHKKVSKVTFFLSGD